jgi:hypothetical protein
LNFRRTGDHQRRVADRHRNSRPTSIGSTALSDPVKSCRIDSCCRQANGVAVPKQLDKKSFRRFDLREIEVPHLRSRSRRMIKQYSGGRFDSAQESFLYAVQAVVCGASCQQSKSRRADAASSQGQSPSRPRPSQSRRASTRTSPRPASAARAGDQRCPKSFQVPRSEAPRRSFKRIPLMGQALRACHRAPHESR